ncbi:hypothetical protein GLAREA_00395 [Glarea lozoyensis ATCC 20868]|uniref:Uncharacterized protein n=1 Tax=Glarea lozoyensis (strain ATCC 20868 / MF5171) TaxID=1116229 RepID=S3CUC0_GLAL2|nr:uncharacterized protein GLAREA_00395 [Glarea lozoyensis ATCC 20868]EPE29235.1 hypothetical protein GLAREA_00395 [Glarea lozoyensis ATCC 20868]
MVGSSERRFRFALRWKSRSLASGKFLEGEGEVEVEIRRGRGGSWAWTLATYPLGKRASGTLTVEGAQDWPECCGAKRGEPLWGHLEPGEGCGIAEGIRHRARHHSPAGETAHRTMANDLPQPDTEVDAPNAGFSRLSGSDWEINRRGRSWEKAAPSGAKSAGESTSLDVLFACEGEASRVVDELAQTMRQQHLSRARGC